MAAADALGPEGLPIDVLLSGLSDPTVLMEPVRDAHGQVTEFVFAVGNAAFDEFLGVDPGGARGLRLTDAQQAAGTDYLFARYVQVLETGQPLALDNVPRPRVGTGEVRYYDLRANRVGPYVGVTFRDVTAYVEATEQLTDSEARFRLLAEHASDLVFRSDGGRLTWVSPSAQRLLGRTSEQLVGLRGSDLVLPDDLHLLAGIAQDLDEHGSAGYTARFTDDQGTIRWLAVQLVRVDPQRPGDQSEVGSARDVTAEMQARAALAESEVLFRTAMQAASVGIGIHDRDGCFRVVNPALCTILGLPHDRIEGRTLLDFVHPEDVARVRQAGAQLSREPASTVTVEIRLVHADGSTVWVLASGALMPDHAHPQYNLITHISDITVEHQQRAELEYRALHDPLTGLYNRTWILDMLDNELRASRPTRDTVAALYIDLDNFKVINDSLGHNAGDEVLSTLAQRITKVLRPRDYAARLGGDEFLIVATDLYGTADVENLAARITTAITETIDIHQHSLVITASVGVALSQPGSTATSLLRDADSALFRAKANGRGHWQFFDDTMHAAALDRLTTESEIRAGLAEHQFVPYFQPIVTLDPLSITGYEALVRWNHPERGVLPPAAFLPIAEETGLIIDIGAHMLDQVCALIASRPAMTAAISVNKSPQQISRPDWRAHLLDTVLRHRIDPHRLIIEVTESAVLTHIDNVANDLNKLRRLGIGLHIDDFGTGYSSIALLRDLPVTGIKLDRSFTEHLTHDPQARVVAAGLASLADGLDLVSIAEGIEEPDQADILTALGWTHGQGYLYGKPQPQPQPLTRHSAGKP